MFETKPSNQPLTLRETLTILAQFVLFALAAAIIVIALLSLPGCKLSCEQWRLAIDQMPAGAAREAAEQEFAKAWPNGCPVTPTTTTTTTLAPEPGPTPDTCENRQCPPGTHCVQENVHGSRSGPPETWTEGTMTRCAPDSQPCRLSGAPTTPVPGATAPPALSAKLNAAMLALKPECGYAGGTCLLGNETQQQWQARVEAKLLELGVSAGQHEATTDEIAMAESCEAPVWHGYHIFVGDTSDGPVPPGGARRTVLWAPQAYRGAWYRPSTPGPQPTVTPTTPPQPAPGCSAPQPAEPGQDGGLGKIAAKPHTSLRFTGVCGTKGDVLRLVDSTPQIYAGKVQPNYCAKIGSFAVPGVGNLWCPARLEGNAERPACEGWALRAKGSTTPSRIVWVSNGCVAVNPDNSFQAACVGAGCWLQACNADRSVCSEKVQP